MNETQQFKCTPLPVAKIFGKAFRFPFRQTRQFWIWVLILSLVSFAISQAESYLLWPLLRDLPVKVRIGVSNVLVGLWCALVFTFLALTCQRIILLEEKHERWVDFFSWNRRETRFFIWVFLIFLVVILVLLLPLVIGDSYFFLTHSAMDFLRAMDYFFLEWLIPKVWIPIIFLFGIYSVPYFTALYMLSRVSLILPAIAIDEKPTISWVWGLSKGNGWRLTFLTTIPIIVYFLFGSILNMVDFMPSPLFWIPMILGSALFFFWIIFEAALLSEAYKELRAQQ